MLPSDQPSYYSIDRLIINQPYRMFVRQAASSREMQGDRARALGKRVPGSIEVRHQPRVLKLRHGVFEWTTQGRNGRKRRAKRSASALTR